MGSITIGTLNDGGCKYTCTISYDAPTRSGDKVNIKNVKATITHISGTTQTRNRIAVCLWINGSQRSYDITVKRANPYPEDYWPTSVEVTLIGSSGYEFTRLENWFYIDATFKSTGYGDWDNGDWGHASTDWNNREWIYCPARTYSVTFNANGGSDAPAAQTKTYNVSLTLSDDEPSYLGYDFKGWSGSNGTTYQPGAAYTGNADLALTAIWEATSSELEDIDDIELGEAPEISWTPQSSSLTYKIKLSLGEWSWESDTISPGVQEELYTYDDYTVPLTVAEQLPDRTSELMKCVLTTYNSGTATGTSEKYFTVTVPDTVVPTITSPSFTDGGENALEVFLQNYSWVKAQATIAGAYGSTITSAKLEVGYELETEIVPTAAAITINSDVIEETDDLTVKLTVTDSRGRTNYYEDDITVYAYAPPVLEVEVTRGETEGLYVEMTPTFSSVVVGGTDINSATLTYDGQEYPAVSGTPKYDISYPTYINSRNQTVTAILADQVTSVTVTKVLYPGKGDRFSTLSEDDFYIGMDDKGWKDTASEYDGGIDENGVVWFTRTSGTGPVGVGIPVQLDPDSDYELIYSADRTDSNMAVFITFFKELFAAEDGFEYMSSTYSSSGYMKSGAVFHTPKLATGTLWGIVMLGGNLIGGRREYSNVILRKIEHDEEILSWEMETGNLGLDTPNQKYISRIQMRIDYVGSLKVEIAYDNESAYKTVHESTCDHMRSITVPIKVKRNDHFRIRLSGSGQTRLYSFGFETDEGSGRCLI